MKCALIFSLMLFSEVVFGLDCSSVNLITEPNSPFQRIPVYDQRSTNICYAYSAAQLIDYYHLKSKADARMTHPAWVALNYALKLKREDLNIGHTKESIDILREVASCDYEVVANSLHGVKGTKVSQVSSVLLPSCKQEVRKKIEVPEVKKFNYEQLNSDEAFEKFLSEQISHSTPLSIAYCSKIWKDPDYDGIDLRSDQVRDQLKRDCDYHESLVVGQKSENGTCQFLVRNTWGDRWRKTNEKWKCLCRQRTTGDYQDNCSPETHSDLEFSVEACWISSSKLAKNTGVVTFFEDPRIIPKHDPDHDLKR